MDRSTCTCIAHFPNQMNSDTLTIVIAASVGGFLFLLLLFLIRYAYIILRNRKQKQLMLAKDAAKYRRKLCNGIMDLL